ncbi:hypothetical protein C0Q70_00421 [Pomacea canaliculata]|uniref:DUF3987 domain-containing protein n=1 Tax=Pomacea canaliculata TaxID=400727 RepID=A0A2T7PWM4_POMCA|nr:hypothetical protein C0Q70_00421 [Pomacea canaliculata]
MNPSTEVTSGGSGGWRESYRTAQMITLPDVTRVCGSKAGQLVIDLAQGTGCPHEYVLMPLLSICAALMGPHSEVRVHSSWSEPPVLWIAIGARASSRKSAALRQVLTPLLCLIDDVQREQRRQLQRGGDAQCDDAVEWRLPLVHTGRYSNTNSPVHCDAALRPGYKELDRIQAGVTGIKLGILFGNRHTNNASAEEPGLESEGRMLHVTERLEDSHHRLNIHPQNPDILSRAQMQDLYEGFAGQFTVSPDSGKEHGRQHLQGHSALWPQVSTVLSHLLCFNQCGFADPEYIVNLTVKSPSWMSGRFLISCPSTAEASPSPFSVPPVDNVESGYGVRAGRERRSKSLTLKNIYRHLAQAHSKSSCRYVFTPEAVLELRRFQEEEWSTIMAQLNTGDHSGVISKSLGHVVRLAGVLKALSEAATLATKGLSRDYAKNLCMEEEEPSEEKEVEIGIDDIARALELGKYFLEQKMSMTFMFSPGFFRNCSTSSQNSQQDQQDMRTTAAAAHGPPAANRGADATAATNKLFSAATHGPGASALSPQARGHLSCPPAPSLAHHVPTCTISPSPSVDIDVTQLPATWMPATPEEELAEMSQTAEFVQLEPTQFIAMHARRVKRLMECFDDGCGVSATTAAQKSIAPPVRVAGTNNRHPAWASALFFQKVSCDSAKSVLLDLGLGIAEQVRHPTNGRVYWRFKRKPVTELTEKNLSAGYAVACG